MPAKWILDALQMTPDQWGRLPFDPATGRSKERDDLIEKARKIRAGDTAAGGQQQPQQQQSGARAAGADDDLRQKLTDLERRVTELEQGEGKNPQQQ